MKLARRGRRTVEEFGDLSQASLLVIALLNMGITDNSEIVEFFIMQTPGQDGDWMLRRRNEAGKFVRKVRNSTNDIVLDSIEFGLPSSLIVSIPFDNTVLCKSCGYKVTVVPCPACNFKEPIYKHAEEDLGDPPPVPKKPTQAPAGSLRKIRLMQMRLNRGESIFHPLDSIRK